MKQKHPILYTSLLVFVLIPSIILVEIISQLLLNMVLPHQEGVDDTVFNDILFLFVGTSMAFVLIYIYRKFIDKKGFIDMGFSLKGRLFDLFMGTSIGVVLISIGFIFLIAIGDLEVSSISFIPKVFIANLVLMILVSVHEEVLVRGYLLNSLMTVNNKYIALIISSVLFGAMHLLNPNVTVLSFLNITLAGILLGVSYIHSKNLWFPMGLHFSWNFFQGPVLGFEVSGQEIKSIITQNISGNDLITGGDFGFEGSIIATILILISIVLIDWFFKRRESLTKKISIDFSENELFIKEQ